MKAQKRELFRRPAGVLLLAAVWLGLAWGCAREPERQWYKIGKPYTMEEFRRDTTQCTRDKKLDADCMRSRGWVDVSPDRPEPSKAETTGTQILPLQKY
jgi:hypothetical protein